MLAEIILAAGCFWGVQATFDKVNGVRATEVGYIGGTLDKPSYKDVSSGKTGHAEAVKVSFDPSVVTLGEILDVFFISHDPTTLNRQGPDKGTQYRSAIFYMTPEQKKAAEEKIKEYSLYFDKPIVTQVVPATAFYPAEEYHQKYFEKTGGRCHVYRNEAMWRKKLSAERYEIMREKGTEKPYAGKYVNFDEKGVYRCGACGRPLFSSSAKFATACGWPGFDRPLPGAVETRKDYSNSMVRDEVVCSGCGSHLGHVFKDGPTETGIRYCINSLALDFEEAKMTPLMRN